MTVLLIYPYFLEPRLHADEIAAVPMGLYYVGAMLKAHGYPVQILNWHAARDATDLIKETLISARPDIIGFSVLTANRWGAVDIAGLAKELNPQVTVIFGGIGATFLWKHLLTHFAQIDAVVLGEGEHTFLKLVRALEAGHTLQDLRDIPGLALRSSEGPFQTQAAAPIVDLDQLPPPARYFDFSHVSLSRGCPGRCTFCGSPQFWGRRVRAHSPDYFVDQLAVLAQRGTTFFYVSDDTFTLDPRRVIAVCRKIVDRGLKITWQAIAKVNAVRGDMLYWMRKAGCVQVSYGVESGSASIRRKLCKDIRIDQIRRAFKLTVGHGILARAYFIYGAPGETWQTIEETLSLIQAIKPLSAIFYILDIFPGTELYSDFKQRTGYSDDIWLQRMEDILYFESDPALDQETVRAFGRHLRKSYHQALPQFALSIELEQDTDLQAEQADFLSRLGMTFSHGDYVCLDIQPRPRQVAMNLFNRALNLHPDQRAFWGAALICQVQGEWPKALAYLEKGLAHFPSSPSLNISLAVSYIHQGLFQDALDILLPFQASAEALPHIVHCYQALGDKTKAAEYAARAMISRHA